MGDFSKAHKPGSTPRSPRIDGERTLNSLLSRGALKREERRRHITMWSLKLQSCFAVNHLSVFGAVADCCQDFVQRAEGRASEARGDLLQMCPMTKLRKFRLSWYHVLPRIQFGTPKPGETWRNNVMKSSKIFQKMSTWHRLAMTPDLRGVSPWHNSS